MQHYSYFKVTSIWYLSSLLFPSNYLNNFPYVRIYPEQSYLQRGFRFPLSGIKIINVPPKFVRASSLVAIIQNQVTTVKLGNTFVKIATRKEKYTVISITMNCALSTNLEIYPNVYLVGSKQSQLSFTIRIHCHHFLAHIKFMWLHSAYCLLHRCLIFAG